VIAASSDSRSSTVAQVSEMGCSVIAPRILQGTVGRPLVAPPNDTVERPEAKCSQRRPLPVSERARGVDFRRTGWG
jgi:hypothetical protein